jgi:hypothetical protein
MGRYHPRPSDKRVLSRAYVSEPASVAARPAAEQHEGIPMSERTTDGQRVSPVVARRQLNLRFVQARKRAGFASRDAAAEALGWSPRKQALLESDEQAIPVRDLDVILPVFAVAETDRPRWRDLAELARSPGWWDGYDDADLSGSGKQYIGFEWGARRLRSFDGSIMPALLQLPAYTVAALDAGLDHRPAEQISRLLAVRRQRQRVLGEPDALQYHVILDEAALHRPAGGPATMRAQLEHLADYASIRPNITVQVVPFGVGLYPGQSGTFVLMDFDAHDDEPGLAHLEPGFTGSVYVEERRALYEYSLLFQRLTKIALDPTDSLALIRDVAGALTRPATP